MLPWREINSHLLKAILFGDLSVRAANLSNTWPSGQNLQQNILRIQRRQKNVLARIILKASEQRRHLTKIRIIEFQVQNGS